MINQDQLTKYERLRLESLAMALNSIFLLRQEQKEITTQDFFDHAKNIEQFLKASNPN